MIRIIIIALLLTAYSLQPTACFSTPLNLTVTYEVDTISGVPGAYGATADRSWVTFDPDGTGGPLPSAPHLTAVSVYAGDSHVASIIDNPANRTTPAITIDSANPRPKITLRQVWLQSPWLANTAKTLGETISAFKREVLLAADYDPPLPADVTLPGFPNTNGYWECTRAGTTGASEPMWDAQRAIFLTTAYKYLLDGKQAPLAGSVIDNGDGTVGLPTPVHHAFVAGEQVTITGTTYYNGIYTLPDQTNGDQSTVVITHAYVAETFGYASPPMEVHLTDAVAVDNGDGTITLPIPGHGLIGSDSATLYGTPWVGAHTLPDQTTNGDADHLVISGTYAPYVSSKYAYVYPTGGNIVDNGGGTVTIPAPAHGYVAGDVIDFVGLANYTGPYTLPVQTNGGPDHIEITAPYVAEVIGPSRYARKRVQDPDTSGAEWQYKTGDAVVGQSHPTGRLIVKDNGNGQATRTGTNFIMRYQ